jgi:hypothetical protein
MESPSAAPAAERLDRVVAADARAGLERIQGSEVLAAGAVNIIGLDAVRRQLGERWPAKRARVWEHIERDLERRLTAHDMFFRLDETSYLIAMPLATRFMAQAACLSILQDVLKFFLGESKVDDVIVRTVSSIENGAVVSEALDPLDIARAAAREASSLSEHAQPAEEWKPPLAGRTQSMTLMTEARRKAELKMGIESVWNLRRGLITSFALQRAVSPKLVNPADVLKMDCAVTGYAVDILKEHREQGGRLALHVPISYASAATRSSREKVLAVAAPVRDLLRSTVLIEIADLDPGVPPSRLIEVVALLKPFCVAVLARIKPTRAALAAVRSCGLQGLVLDALDVGRSPAETTAWMKAFVEAGHGGAPNFIVHNLAAPQMVDAAAKVGMTHASIRPELSFETEIDAA